MNTEFCRAPTAAETKALASLPSVAPPQYQNVREALAEILAFSQRPDIYGFLFTPEPIQVSHFLKPNLLEDANTGFFLATSVGPGKELEHSVTQHSTGSFLIYPAFVSQNLSFGFAVDHVVHSPANKWETQEGFPFESELRFVRDNKKRTLLVIADAEGPDIIQFQYTRQLSLTCELRTAASFYRKEFKLAIAGKNSSVADVIKTMFRMETGVEYRLCPLCMASNDKCRCKLPDYEPKHPFDREVVQRTLQMHLGSFEGSKVVASLNNGKLSHSVVGSRVTVERRLDRELSEKLRRWVLRKHCASHNPWQSCLFTDNDPNQKAESSLSVQDSKLGTGAEELLKTLGRSSEVAGSFLSPQDSYSYLSELLGTAGAGGLEASDTTSGLTNRAILMPELRETSVQSSGTVAQRESTERLKKRISEVSLSSRGAVKGDSDLDEIQRRKEERRKEQNRVSARRSNQKKKAFNDALKLSLKEMHERAAFLRARELQLRKENLELKKCLGASDATL